MEAPTLAERYVVGALVKTAFLRDRRRAPPPALVPNAREVVFEGNTGAHIAARWFAAEKPRGAVVLAHPDKRLAKAWFEREGHVAWLHENGYDVLTFDFPGYGASRGPATYYHEDVLAAFRFARDWSGMLPVHVWGVSMGAFAAANASPHLDGCGALVLESPYPNFNSWYGDRREARVMAAFDKWFPRSSRAIQADKNVADAAARRILVAIAEDDDITPVALSVRVADAAPQERTNVVHVPGKHFAPFANAGFRSAVLDALV
jgi:pimeloyl-ACP methyl ester carboxylesterase